MFLIWGYVFLILYALSSGAMFYVTCKGCKLICVFHQEYAFSIFVTFKSSVALTFKDVSVGQIIIRKLGMVFLFFT